MPILVKDFNWSESKDAVFVTVPLKGVKATNVGLMCTNEFVKANYPPFLFEVVLYKEIVDEKSSAKVRSGSVEFNLVKAEPEIWGRLESEKSEDKSFVLEKKLEAVEYVRRRTEKEEKVRAKMKSEDKRYAIREMMKLEEVEKSRIESVKESERKRTENEMEEWKAQKKLEEEEARIKLLDDRIEESFKNMSHKGTERKNTESNGNKEIFVEENQQPSMDDNRGNITQCDDNVVQDGCHENIVQCDDNVAQDGDRVMHRPKGTQPRQGGKISFKFTPRVFPTPLRESKTHEEEEWLRNQAEARKTKEIDDPDLEEHEKDPEWLKTKGNKLFSSGNFLAAVNAYNLAISLRPKMHVLYLNRAACHLRLRNFYKCIEDCSVALELLQPPVPANAKARLKAHIRRGTGFCELELYAEGLLDYNKALEIDPKNEGLQKDAENIKNVIEKGDVDAAVVTEVTT